uniref:Uncharacterized protein n=1 Tax=Periophthalmus magnuspinnatus TaxID=409849 RepID=A0A3B4BMH7_9GOBI
QTRLPSSGLNLICDMKSSYEDASIIPPLESKSGLKTSIPNVSVIHDWPVLFHLTGHAPNDF